MIQIVADNIISPLGFTTTSNVEALRGGKSALKKCSRFYSPTGEDVVASVIDDAPVMELLAEVLGREGVDKLERLSASRLERLIITSVASALGKRVAQLADSKSIMILSTTKGNIASIGGGNEYKVPLWHSAKVVADFFSAANSPIVISNACISGVAATIVAKHLIESGIYNIAVVVGADEVTEFVVSGFGSFKALSPEPCRPFDAQRKGLNLGEAVATIAFERIEQGADYEHLKERSASLFTSPQVVTGGAISNDANHISGPSRTAEGLYRAISKAIAGADVNAGSGCGIFVNPHGTATLYNDQMESIALQRSNLEHLPLSPLKGYYGHTLGAAGVIETILSSHFMDEEFLPPALGYDKPGCEPAPKIHREGCNIDAGSFIKLVSGFGGCNAVIKVDKLTEQRYEDLIRRTPITSPIELYSRGDVRLYNQGDCKEYLNFLYKQSGMSYPKFHKMDLLSKAGIIAMEQLLKEEATDDTTALIFMNSSASYSTDSEYVKTIVKENFFPSPALFVYTLPSIVMGEIAIRHKLYGEGVFFVAEEFEPELMLSYAKALIGSGAAKRAILCYDECTEALCDLYAVMVELVASFETDSNRAAESGCSEPLTARKLYNSYNSCKLRK